METGWNNWKNEKKKKKITAVLLSKQPELKTKSCTLRSDMNYDNNTQKTAHPVNRKKKN